LFGVLGSILATIALSFTSWDLLTPPRWAGLANFVALFTDPKLSKALSNTFLFSLLYVPCVVIVSLLVALLLNRKIRGVSIFRTIYFLPAVTSAVATALVWNMIYGRDTGILNYIIELLGGKAICWLCTDKVLFALIIVNVWGAIGEGMIIFLAGFTAVPKDYYEAAMLDGASNVQQFLRITIPLVTPSIFFQTLISTINAFQAYDYIYMLTRRGQGDSSFPVVVYSIYRNAWTFFNYGGASAQAIELAVFVIALMAFYFWLERRYVVYE
jgi:multiple sugar transport system permease protein